jgi:3-isopropylmalate/(R)-2-methylmalate dehydratase small subunit
VITARAIVIRHDNVDTDALYPGRFIHIVDPQQARNHLFEGLDARLRTRLDGPTVLFVADNFGCGSSREQPVSAMVASGVLCVVGRSFARIFGRNAVNCGLPAFVNPHAVDAVEDGAQVSVELGAGLVRVGEATFASAPISTVAWDILEAGGLVKWVRTQMTPRAL